MTPDWATKCAEALHSARLMTPPQTARVIAEHAEAHARARERAVVEAILAMVCGGCQRKQDKVGKDGMGWYHEEYDGNRYRCDGAAIRERYAEILREEGKP